jgi:hypothetical protein
MNIMPTTLGECVSTVKWQNGENAMPGRREGQENEPGQEGRGEGEPQDRSINKRDN